MIDPATLIHALKAALARRDRSAVNDVCRGLIALRAPLGAQWRALAAVLVENGEMTEARRAIDLLVAATGNSAMGRFAQAETYARSGCVADAHAIMQALPRDIPDPLGNAYILGTTATNLGRFDVARDHLRRAVRVSPQSGQSWLALATLGPVAPDDGAAMLAARAAIATAPPAERGPFFHALGKYLHEQDDHDAAFAAFAQGAAAERELRPVDEQADRQSAAAAIEGWTQAALASLPRPTRAAPRPIFVTGLPRSGTTLVEQILASHSGIDGGEELGLFRHLVAEIGGTDFAAVKRAGQGGRFDALIDLHAHLLAERFPGSARVVDKSLQASRYMGVIAALFPDAPVVWLRRDPLDNAWSIFRTYFRNDLAWSFDLRAIAAEMRREDALFAHWTQVRPDHILAVDYAQLVADPDHMIPRIVAHCGLALEAQQLRPHESRRAVTTASVAQVRAPINRDAIGAADPYRRHLQPFIDAYAAG